MDIRINHTYQIVYNGKHTWVRVIGPKRDTGERLCEIFSTGELIHVPEAALPEDSLAIDVTV